MPTGNSGTAVGNAVGGVANAATGVVTKASGWIDQIFGFFGLYTTQYSKYIVYGLLILAVSKVMKFKFNINTGGKR